LILIDSAGVNGRCAKIADLLDRAAAALHLSERSRIGLRTPFGRISTLWGDAELFVMRAKRLVMGARRGRVAAYFGRRAPQAPIEEYRRFRAYLRVVAKYVPLSYDGPITLLFPQDDMPERSQHLAGWRCVSPTVSVETVPGTHSTCITTFANETATRIGEHLKNAQS
jgi:hypothetical protein